VQTDSRSLAMIYVLFPVLPAKIGRDRKRECLMVISQGRKGLILGIAAAGGVGPEPNPFPCPSSEQGHRPEEV
jgi:hypothetical protein